MSNERLTRQEISWLLAQEARGAAKALRDGVTRLTNPPPGLPAVGDAVPGVRVSLDALDDAISMLSDLQAEQGQPSVARRGRIDVAALLCEIAPNARIALAPGEGTEVFGEERELARLLHVLLNQSLSGTTAESGCADIEVQRVGEMVKISVDLGPDSSATQAVEKRWLSRMAVRHGGLLEYEGGRQSVLLPADGASDQREVVELRKELAQAQKLGEAYARELATVFADVPSDAGQTTPSTAPSGGAYEALVALARALEPPIKDCIDDAAGALGTLKPAGSTQEIAVATIDDRLARLRGLSLELAAIARSSATHAAEFVDVATVAQDQVTAVKNATRASHLVVSAEHEGAPKARLLRGPFELLLRSLIAHAVAATPKDGTVTLLTSVQDANIVVRVADGGTSVPNNARVDLLKQRVDPSQMGRPGGISLLAAHAAAGHLGGTLGLGETSDGATEVRARVPIQP